MNLNFMYAHCCGTVRSFKVAHLTLSHLPGRLELDLRCHRDWRKHNGLAADAYSHRT